MLYGCSLFTSHFSIAMAIIAFDDKSLPKTQTKSNKWLESALLHLEEMVTVLNAKNAVMFESDGSEIKPFSIFLDSLVFLSLISM